MLVCTGQNCVMPAKWRLGLAAMPAAHWGPGIKILRLEVCFCDIHRASAKLDELFSDNARRALDVQFCKANLQVPDWSLSKLVFEAIDPDQHKRHFATYTVYLNPSDFPNKYVVRKHVASADAVFPQELLCVEDTLEAARAKIPRSHIRTNRQPEDDPAIFEVWI